MSRRPAGDDFESQPLGTPERARHIDLRRTLYSFRHAGRGFAWALSSQANLRVHFVAAAVVLIAALVLRFSVIEFVALVLCFTVVVAAELFNTTLEVLIDYAWPEHHPIIGRDAFLLLSQQAVARTPDVTFEVERLVSQDETVVVIGEWVYTSPQGRVRQPSVSVVDLKDGLIWRDLEYLGLQI